MAYSFLSKKKNTPQFNFYDFDSIKITVASPEQVRSWAYGEVKKPETINYRTFKPERDGLFCERIFGPVRDWECNCGKYKFVKHKGVVCDRCGVEVTESRVRRERMGSIELAVPVSHVWFLRKPPSKIGMFLEIPLIDLERVIYYLRYFVLEELKDSNGKVVIKEKSLLTPEEYNKYKMEFKDKLKADIGAGAIRRILEKIDLQKEITRIEDVLRKTQSEAERARMTRRFRLFESFIKANMRPEWMIMTVLPVIPPDLRPLVLLEGSKFATSDLNDLYRRIINRNNRLKHIQSLKAPEIMINNEKRLLQEAVDALFENGARSNPVVGAGNRPLKSFSDILKGKQGRFRQNLLGKRVDYSGRSVIVVGPNLKLHQCGLPKEMAVELFKPFLLHELIKQENITLKAAKRILEKQQSEIWNLLEKIIKNHPVMLNRAPTLHRMSIQAFEPVLVEGKAIRLHPLTCAAFNADFDGDQMAVHVPLSPEAQLEAKLLMMAPVNIFTPASGKPIAVASQDMVLGIAYMTAVKTGEKGEGKIFADTDEVISSFQRGYINLHAKIKVKGINKLFETDNRKEYSDVTKWKDFTTCGRVLFNEVIPEPMRFVNKIVNKKELVVLVERCYRELGHYRTVIFLDDLKMIGYKYATKSGMSISISDMITPEVKKDIIKNTNVEIMDIEKLAMKGLITETERYNKIIDIWMHVTDKISDIMFDNMRKESDLPYNPNKSRFNPVYMMAYSGARGNQQQVRQLAGMRGLMAKPQKKITGQVGEIIESPVVSNFREGLTVLEYFISTHGGRKGLADTALKTADAGYLTRKLVDVAHNIVVTEEDCGTINGVKIGALQSGEELIEPLEERIVGRIALDNVAWIVNDATGEPIEETIVKEGEIISFEKAKKIVQAGIEQIRIRSILTCEAKSGICAKCYGLNLATGRISEVGEAVGIIGAQSIGEPGTQLTLRTFHIGGTASRVVRSSQIVAENDATIKFYNLKAVKNKDGNLVVLTRNCELVLSEINNKKRNVYKMPFGSRLKVKDNDKVKKGELVAEWDAYALPIISEYEGKIEFEDIIEGKTLHREKSKVTGLIEYMIVEYRGEKFHPQIVVNKNGKRLATYPIPIDTILVVNNGDKVGEGDIIAKIPQEVVKTKDITGGLPRVMELFEARHPKSAAVISEIDGIVKVSLTQKGTPKVTIVNEQSGMSREYIIPTGRHLVIYEGDKVGAGEPLTDGAIDPHDVLKVKGAKEVQEFLVNEIQQVYRLQGVGISDKHIEIIVRQMLSNVRTTNPGSSKFLSDEIVSHRQYEEERSRLEELRKKVSREKGREESKKIKIPEMQPILLGITKASLSSESFISAASFQETTRILTEAATLGQVDNLKGLKENVIIGHLIPAGTGLNKQLVLADVTN
ncbi:MAG: DNA-directed RNA polymerase subunit beta' [Elusimicrobia bacterium RIFOXYA2_FULL_39_19]|nr:MAG: DNA-directed RNA polymerase subunit beta' [Elusimicrobia bacterium RIFOXYA2_FULL_39_19]